MSLAEIDPLDRGCEMWVVREGYEGLVRGNAEAPPPTVPLESCTAGYVSSQVTELPFVKNLRFGDGELFKQGEGDAEDRPDKKTLKGRYIVKVGWDDVRGWMGEVSSLFMIAYKTFI
jgi:6-phosphofructokinase 1